jgi:hypothetical protein
MALDLRLRRKQEFWETPRNLAILVGVTAAIAAAIGFWLGRGSATPPAPSFSPAALGGFEGMSGTQFIDAVETAGIFTIASVLIYVVVRLERALTVAAEKIRPAIGRQQQFESALDRLHQQANDVIDRMRETQQTFIPPRELRTTLNELSRRLDRLEAGHEAPPIDH